MRGIAHVGRTGGIGTDVIALHHRAGGPGADDVDADVAVAGNDVAVSRRGATDLGICRIEDVHPDDVDERDIAVGIRSDVVASDRDTRAVRDGDALGRERMHHQATHDTEVAAGLQIKTGGDRVPSVQHDARGSTVGAIDRDLAGDRRQHAGQIDRAEGAEGDGIGPTIRVGIGNGLPERPCAGVVQVGDGVGGQRPLPFGLGRGVEGDGVVDLAGPCFQRPVTARCGRASQVVARGHVGARQVAQLVDKGCAREALPHITAVDQQIRVRGERLSPAGHLLGPRREH